MDKDKQNQNGGEASSNLEDNLTEIREEESVGAEIEEQLVAGEVEYKEVEPAEEERKEPQRETVEKKTNAGLITLVVVLALALAAAVGRGVWQMVQNGRQEAETGTDTGPEKDEDDKHEGEGEGAKVEEVALDDPVVQRLYEQFAPLSSLYWGGADFYVDHDAKSGNPSKKQMLLIAYANAKSSECKVSHWSLLGYDAASDGCYEGKEIIRKVQEIFGKDITLNAEDTIGYGCGWSYDDVNDEFYSQGQGCGGMYPWVLRGLYHAERDDERIYLYEVAAVTPCNESLFCYIGEDEVVSDRPIDFLDEFNTSNPEPTITEMIEHKDKLDKFKWTFKKNADGEYVFAGLERL